MGDMPRNRHGLIPMLVAIRVAGQRRQREAEAEAATGKRDDDAPDPPKKKKRGLFG